MVWVVEVITVNFILHLSYSAAQFRGKISSLVLSSHFHMWKSLVWCFDVISPIDHRLVWGSRQKMRWLLTVIRVLDFDFSGLIKVVANANCWYFNC